MREALALITFILLFWVGWKQSYREHLADFLGEPSYERRITPRQVVATSATGESSSGTQGKNGWMWDRGILDNPNELKASNAR
jgi:hypothetical protein